MFGCCNNLFSSCCRCGRGCGCNRGGGAPVYPFPTPVFPPVTPPQPQRLRGMQLSLTGQSGGTLAVGALIPFDTINTNNTLGVSYAQGSGSIVISRAGTYLVNWWIALENAQPVERLSFATSASGVDVQTSYIDIGSGQIFGTAIVNVTSVPTTLQLVNRSDDTVTYASVRTQAGLTLTQLA